MFINYWQEDNVAVLRIECQGEELLVKLFAKSLREFEGRALNSRRKAKMHSQQ